MDADGIPLAFSMFPCNHNEQTSLAPLEKKVISDFGIDKLVVCTDSSLSSTANRRFNDTKGLQTIINASYQKNISQGMEKQQKNLSLTWIRKR